MWYVCVFLKYSPFSRKLGTWKKLWSNLGLGLFAYQLGFCKTCVESPNKLSRKKQDQVGHIYFIFFFYVWKGFCKEYCLKISTSTKYVQCQAG
jgi:hypothetical protein